MNCLRSEDEPAHALNPLNEARTTAVLRGHELGHILPAVGLNRMVASTSGSRWPESSTIVELPIAIGYALQQKK